MSPQTPQGRTMSEYRFERTFLAELYARMTGMHRLYHFGWGHYKGHSDDSWGSMRAVVLRLYSVTITWGAY